MRQRLLAVLPLLVLFLLPGPFCSASGQQENNTPEAQISKAVKFDEFGDILISELKARLDNYSIQLQQQPHSRGFIIVYRSRRDLPGLSHSLPCA